MDAGSRAMQFQVSIGDVIVGESSLEHGDAPMGVAFGALNANSVFEQYRTQIDADGFVRAPESIRIRDQSGEDLTGQAISIQVFLMDDEPDELEVSILGMDSSDYERWFKHHIEAYEKQFR